MITSATYIGATCNFGRGASLGLLALHCHRQRPARHTQLGGDALIELGRTISQLISTRDKSILDLH